MTVKLKPLPPKEAIEYLAAKGLAVSFDWRDVYAEEHAAAFTVAKMARLDLLATVREHVQRAIQEGRTLKQFSADLRPILEREGWWGQQEMTDPATGETRLVQLGSPRRLQIIYDTNLRTAYAAGRWERAQRSADILPLLTYRTMRDGRVRDFHRSWDGVTLDQSDPWWDTHYPPNGWRCRCMAYAISEKDAQKLADAGRPIQRNAPPTQTRQWTNPRTGEIRHIPAGIDPGFDYNPGKVRMANLERLLKEKEAAFESPAFIKAALSVQEAERVALDLGAKTVDYANHLDIANRVNSVLDDFARRGIKPPEHVRVDVARFVNWARQVDGEAGDLLAAFTFSHKTGSTYLFLNPASAYWLDAAAFSAHERQSGYWSTGDADHGVRHELGHLTHYRNAMAIYTQNALLEETDKAVAAQVSGYATDGVREFVAETFAALLAGRELDAQVLELYRKFGGVMP